MRIITGIEPMVTPYLGGGYETRIGAAMLRTHKKPEVQPSGLTFTVRTHLGDEIAVAQETDAIERYGVPIQAVRSEEPNPFNTIIITYSWYEVNVKED